MKHGKLAQLRNGLGRDARVIAISAAVASLVTATPAVAAFVANSDKVDGKHAVGSGASVEARKGKLVATDKKGLLPNNILGKALNADKLDGLDSGDLRVPVAGSTAETNPVVNGCGEAVPVSYPLEVARPSHVFTTAWAGLHVSSDVLHPRIRVELLEGAKTVATSNHDAWSGRDGDQLDLSGLLFDQKTQRPYVAPKGSYTLRIDAQVSGYCDSTLITQFQDARLTHLLFPAAR